MAINDWLPLVTSIGGTAVGLGGVYATLRSSRRQHETTLNIARMQLRHEAKLAETDRQQRRLEETYAHVVRWLVESDGAMRTAVAIAEGGCLSESRWWNLGESIGPTLERSIDNDTHLWSDDVRSLMGDYVLFRTGISAYMIQTSFCTADLNEGDANDPRMRMSSEHRDKMMDTHASLNTLSKAIKWQASAELRAATV